nr:UDP-2,3-diacylglucosamine diphosphatase [Pseudomonadota bacterium]
MQQLFISDLHLSPEHPRLVRGFLALVDSLSPTQTNALYILGDWFEAWVGDDDDSDWLGPIVDALNVYTQAGGQVYVLHGNRDFLLGQGFLDRFAGKLLPEVSQLTHPTGQIRLEHGDLLCTDDVKYQQFRQMSRDPAWQAGMLAQPLEQRRQIAQMMRMQSQLNNANTPMNIMDVNAEAVATALQEADILLHGHTHRPETHLLAQGKQRVVLGDWREDSGTAVIARLGESGLVLETWRF